MYSGLTARITEITDSVETTLAYISNFSVEETRDMIEVASFTEKYKEKKPMRMSWSASADGAADFDVKTANVGLANEANTFLGQARLREMMVQGSPVKVRFYLNTGNKQIDAGGIVTETAPDTSTYMEGEAYIESLSIDVSAEDKANISISLSGNKALTYVVKGKEQKISSVQA